MKKICSSFILVSNTFLNIQNLAVSQNLIRKLHIHSASTPSFSLLFSAHAAVRSAIHFSAALLLGESVSSQVCPTCQQLRPVDRKIRIPQPAVLLQPPALCDLARGVCHKCCTPLKPSWGRGVAVWESAWKKVKITVRMLFPSVSQPLIVNPFSLHSFSFLQEKNPWSLPASIVKCSSSLSYCSKSREVALGATTGCTWPSGFSFPPANKTKTAMASCSLCVARNSLKRPTGPGEELGMSWEDRISENSLNWTMCTNPQPGVCKSGNTWCRRLCPVQWLILETLEHAGKCSGSPYPREDIHIFKGWLWEVENIFLTNLRNFNLSYFSLHSPQWPSVIQ